MYLFQWEKKTKLAIEVTLPSPQDQNLMCDFHTDCQYSPIFYDIGRPPDTEVGDSSSHPV